MSDVKLAVGGRNYTVSCADGQEDHVQRLAGIIDSKLGSMGANLSSNEAKNLLFAALLVADELDEAKRAAGQLERMAAALENAASTLEGEAPAS